jgi:hypothetical protein
MAQPRTLVPSSDLDKSFMDLLDLMISKRPVDPKDTRLFLQANPGWAQTGNWFKNQPIGISTLRTWFKESAQKIGLDTSNKKKRLTNQSHRATAVTLTTEAGGAATEICRITGHNNPASLSSYTDPSLQRRGELKDKAFLEPKKIDLPNG